ncbi:hypothetical protein [uncultured Anaerococcus sp.]|uniref:hypothetical protein n=1 Tax=uncultured Anaerococcus sp. TaxID=293428 RepID=UPI0026282B15|nr:hypothetical protein [uncultured Anaerococcus sp.]
MKKKNIAVMILALGLVSCGNNSTPTPPPAKDNTEEAETVETNNGKEVEVEDKNQEESEDESEDPKPKESSSKEEEDIVIPVSKKEKSTDKDDSGDDKKDLSKDLFYIPGISLVKLNDEGKVSDEEGNVTPSQAISYDKYVKYSNNIIVEENPSEYTSYIYRVDKDKKTLLYEFEKGEEFEPLGLIGDKIYGIYRPSEFDESTSTYNINKEESAIGLVDLSKGELKEFTNTQGQSIAKAAVIDGELRYTVADTDNEDSSETTLYSLDTSKDYDQEPELIDEDFGQSDLYAAKYFEDDNPVYKFFVSDGDNVIVDDKEFAHYDISEASQDFVGKNLFTVSYVDTEEYNPFLYHLKIENFMTGDVVLDEDIQGIKLEDGKLYYISADNKIESVDLDL